MRKCSIFVLLLLFLCSAYAQKESILDYDPCSEQVSSALKKEYEKAFSYFQQRKYQKASLLLNDILKQQDDFASAHFLMGLIGVNTHNDKMIEKYFPLCYQSCDEFSHPLMWYYLGLIEYSNENYLKAQKHFQSFIESCDEQQIYDSLQDEAINYLNWSDFLAQVVENPVDFNPHPVNFLAEKMNYYEPFFTLDGKEIYFQREEIIRQYSRDSFLSNQESKKEVFTAKSTLDDHGNYDRGFKEDFPFNNGKTEGRVSITADNNLLFFSIKNTEKENSSWDIVYCEKYDGFWSEPKRLNICTNSFDELQPCISPDGNTLYFVSDRSGGKGKYDIWCSKRLGKNLWDDPVNMGPMVNTSGNEMMPTVSMDGRKIYFLSNGWRTIGGFDIFYNDLSLQQKPKNIGYPINTEDSERGIGIMADGKTAYTTLLDKDKKYYQINTFLLPKEAQAEERVLYNAHTDLEVATDIILTLLDLDQETSSDYFVSNTNNNFTLMLAKEKDYLLFYSHIGYMFYSKIINSWDTDSLVVSVKPLASGQSMPLNNIEINPLNNDFTHQSTIILNLFVNFLKAHPHTRITLLASSEMLDRIYNYLIRSGIREDKISKQTTHNQEIFYKID